MLTIEKMMDIINQISSIQLTLLGIAITIFTVLYAFIINKKEELKNLSYQLKRGDKSPLLLQRMNFISRNVNKLKQINHKLSLIVLYSFIFFIYSWCVSVFNIFVNLSNFIFIMFLLTIEFIYMVKLLIGFYKNYRKEIRI